MNRIVRGHYPVAALPDDLREGLPADASVRVTIEAEPALPDRVMTLDELFAMRTLASRSIEDVVDDLRRQRDESDE